MWTWIIVIVLLAAALIIAGLVARSYLDGGSIKQAVFGARPEKRLAVVEQASIDGRRRLLLLRRDGVEHLIMTGGPVDVVIETGIGATQNTARNRTVAVAQHDDHEPAQPVFTRQPRTLGQVVND